MFRIALRTAPLAVLLAASIGGIVCPARAVAQQPEASQAFDMRMSNRIDGVQSNIRRIQKELDGDSSEDDGPRGGYDTNSGLRQRLQALDDQCRDLERELRGAGMPRNAAEEYQRQRNIEYYVMGMENQIRDIRKWMRQGEAEAEEAETPADTVPGPDTVEDGITDEQWAEEWATGGR